MADTWRLGVFLACLAAWPGGAHAEVYRCTDAQGRVTFSDAPCGDNMQIIAEEHPRPGEALAPAPPYSGAAPDTLADSRGRTVKTLGGYPSPFTLGEALRFGARYAPYLLAYFAAPPLLALLLMGASKPAWRNAPPLNYVYSALVYAVAVPGVFSTLLVGYALFFSGQNLLEVDALVYFVPLLSMLLTLPLIAKSAALDDLPGVDRIAGLVTVLAVVCGSVLLIYKTRIFIGFFGSIESLAALGIFLFILLKWGLKKLFD